MYAVGRLISRSIYTVSGPFHPFGGAVDIVVVEQPDGSYKSSPWYVRFGKFQGVLKRREKVVSICVNGVDADFHMYLDHTGEAYFFEEVEEEVEEIVVESSLSSELTNEDLNSHTPMKSLSCNFDAEGSLIDSPETGSGRTRTGSKRARLLGLVFGRRLSQGEPSPDVGRANSLDRAEIAADLLDANWSTELALDKPKLQKLSLSFENLILNDECFINGDSLDQNLALTSADESLIQETSGLITEFSQEFSELHIQVRADEQRREKARMLTDTDPLSPCLVECPSDIKSLQEIDTSVAKEFIESQQAPQSNGSIFGNEVKLTESVKTNYTKQISGESLLCKDDVIDCEGTPLIEDSCNLKVNTELSSILGDDAGLRNLCPAISSPRDTILQSEIDREVSGEGHEDEQFIFSDDEFKPTEHRKTSLSSSSSVEKELDTLVTNEDANSPEANDNNLISCNETFALLEKDLKENAEKKFEELLEKQQQKISFPIDIHGFYDANTEIDERMVESLPNMWSQIDSLEADLQPCRSFDASANSPRWLSVRNNVFVLRKSNEDVEEVTAISEPTAAADDEQAEMPKSDSVSSGVGDPSKTIVVPSGTWRLWPFAFKRATSLNNTTPLVNPSSNNVSSSDVKHPTESATHTTENIIKSEVRRKVVKKMMRSITPTSAQLKSLSLNEGGNLVTFTFSTAMLGKQQVDARIYLWKWDARIVISDVDGTITKSDVLGQFMPMVGYDWSHIGVTHLFSAIKENGYQLLFLSARSISQSYITRQFLFNLKQDGKTLPDGPVVISPDGLFPSLYREVIRRAPHEFKIACLEDIKALFPPECNPFYAGFGNRDTDEISYLKVGIPKGKIFIINPKGEVKVHRRVDTNSYTDLHTLANGIFPPICSSEQEDFNSWNFWKLPPCMDLEL